MKKIAIIILNWNGKKDTIECLESIGELRITRPHRIRESVSGEANYELRIIVVDNGSTDGSVTALRNFQFPISKPEGPSFAYFQFKLIENKENFGFSEGNNVGIKKALEDGADYVMILNNDTIVDEMLIDQLITTMQDHPEAGILCPKIYFAKGFEFHKQSLDDPSKKRYKKQELGRVLWYAGGFIDWNNVLLSHRGVDEIDKGQYEKIEETDFATGACMFFKKEVFTKVGFLDKNYFLYLEDADFCFRTKRAGFKILYVPSAHLWHKVAQSSSIGSQLNDYYITRNRLIFGTRYASLRSKLALIRESIRLMFSGRMWQRKGALDFYLGKLGKGSFAP